MANEIAIPILPSASMNDTLALYQALGFTITYQQRVPNIYAVVQREDLVLHFFVLKGLQPGDSYATCIVQTPDADGLYTAFAAGLRARYGRLPVTGMPRITPIRNKSGNTRGFNLVDTTGNWIRVVQELDAPAADEDATQDAGTAANDDQPQSSLARALVAAETLTDSHCDYALAASMLDKALARNADAPTVDRVRALILRSVAAHAIGETDHARTLLAQVHALPLSARQREALAPDFQRLADLAESLT